MRNTKIKRPKCLTEDEFDLFIDSINGGLFSIYYKLFNDLTTDLSKSVLSYNLNDLSEKSLGELALLKAEVQGMHKLTRRFASLREAVKNNDVTD